MWRIHVRIILIVVIFTVVGGIVFVLTSYRYLSKPEKMNLTKITSTVDIGLQEVHHVAVKNGKKQWELQSETVQRISGESFFSPLTLTFFPNNSEPIKLFSKKGCVSDNKNIEITDHITIKQSPWTISCEEVFYSYTDHSITAKKDISLTGPEMVLSANSVNYNLNTGSLIIQEAVSLTVIQHPTLNH